MSIAMHNRDIPLTRLRLNPHTAFSRRYRQSNVSTRISKITKKRENGEKLTSQSHILRNNLQVLRPTQLRTQGTASLHNLLAQLLIPLFAPVVVLAAATENHAAAQRAGKDVCGCWIEAVGRAEVPVDARVLAHIHSKTHIYT